MNLVKFLVPFLNNKDEYTDHLKKINYLKENIYSEKDLDNIWGHNYASTKDPDFVNTLLNILLSASEYRTFHKYILIFLLGVLYVTLIIGLQGDIMLGKTYGIIFSLIAIWYNTNAFMSIKKRLDASVPVEVPDNDIYTLKKAYIIEIEKRDYRSIQLNNCMIAIMFVLVAIITKITLNIFSLI